MPSLSEFIGCLFDADGTLIPQSKQLAPEVTAYLQELSMLGYLLGVASGKSYAHLHNNVLQAFPKHSLHITCGGAQIVTSEGDVVWEKNIPATVVEPLTQKLLEAQASFYLAEGDTLYSSPRLFEYLLKHPMKPKVILLEKAWSKPTPSIGIYHYDDNNIDPIIHPFASEIHHIDSSGGRTSQVHDVTANGVHKGAAVMEWCVQNDIPPEMLITFGDGDNDEAMFTVGGFGVAMGNSTPKLKSIADRVIGDVEENGLGLYLQSILATGKL
jgi:5-amino-6-(5-phospho-D-ribitylamino)uracil phosphatase